MAKTYIVNKPIPGYYTYANAQNHTDQRSIVGAGTYYVFNESEGMVNVTTDPKTPGSWINPADNAPTTVSTNSNNLSAKTANNVGVRVTSNNMLSVSGAIAPANCYIYNLLTGSKIEFYLPDSFIDTNTANFEDVAIRGRSTPLRGYDSSGPRSISFDLDLHDDYCPIGLKETVKKMRALTYPSYKGYAVPPECYIKLAEVFSSRATVNSVSVSYEKPYRDGHYVKATVSLDITPISDSLSAEDIEKGVDFS